MPMPDPWVLMLLLAVIIPAAFLLCAALPIYSGMYFSLWQIYAPEPGMSHPLAGQFTQFSVIFEQYRQLVEYWQAAPNVDSELTLWLFGPPAFGALAALFLLWRCYRYVRSIFCVDDL